MNNKLEQKLYHDLSPDLEVPSKVRTIIKESINNVEVKKKNYSIIRIALTTCATLILTVGIVYAGTKVYDTIWKKPEMVKGEIEKNTNEEDGINCTITEQEAKEKAIEMLKLTGIPNPENCFKQYPYELSGGMQQRVMIAMALSCEPKLLIADEPTTALDVTIQEQILQLIRELNEKLGMSVLFITHDMGAVANLCHNVKVMYLGQVVEEASTEELFQNPLHPYTQGLLSCIPHLGVKKGEPLPVIEGSVPPLSKVPVGCHFCTRCKMADQHCMEHEPPACEVAPGHVVKCWKYAESGKQEV